MLPIYFERWMIIHLNEPRASVRIDEDIKSDDLEARVVRPVSPRRCEHRLDYTETPCDHVANVVPESFYVGDLAVCGEGGEDGRHRALRPTLAVRVVARAEGARLLIQGIVGQLRPHAHTHTVAKGVGV